MCCSQMHAPRCAHQYEAQSAEKYARRAESLAASWQACGTVFLLLGGAWTKVGQPMLNVLQMVRLGGLRFPSSEATLLVVALMCAPSKALPRTLMLMSRAG